MPTNLELLAGHYYYAILHSTYKKRKRGCKYLGSAPIYVERPGPSISMHRIPHKIYQSFVDKIDKMCYTGLYDTGSAKIPMFKESENNVKT